MSNNKLKLYIPFTKQDEEQRMVWGYCSTETVDSEGEVVTKGAIRGAWNDYMKWANIREMHQLSAVGKTKEYMHDDKGTWIGVKVVDDSAWKKVKEGVYMGFSIGGDILRKAGEKIEEIILNEISLVDRPACSEAKFEVVKRSGAKLVEGESAKVGTTQEEHLIKENMDKEIITNEEEEVTNTKEEEIVAEKEEEIVAEVEEEVVDEKEEEVVAETEDEEDEEEEEEEEETVAVAEDNTIEEEEEEEEEEEAEKSVKTESLEKSIKQEVEKSLKDSLSKVKEIEEKVSALREEVEALKKVKNRPKTAYTIEKDFKGADDAPKAETYQDLVKGVGEVTEKINKVHERAKSLIGTENFSEEMKVNEELSKLQTEFLAKKRALENFGRNM